MVLNLWTIVSKSVTQGFRIGNLISPAFSLLNMGNGISLKRVIIINGYGDRIVVPQSFSRT
jgi:hypothetical protein